MSIIMVFKPRGIHALLTTRTVPRRSSLLRPHLYQTTRRQLPGWNTLATQTSSLEVFPTSSSISRQHQYTTTTTCLFAKKSSTVKTSKPTTSSDRPYKLVIVESPSKCKTIEKILQQYVTDQKLDFDFVVTSCYGHIRNLPKNNQQLKNANLPLHSAESKGEFPYSIVGVNLNANDNLYEPTYVVLPGKEKLLRELQSLAQNADQVLLATDPDREGEAIAWHLQALLQLPTGHHDRLLFTEITPQAIRDAVAHPQTLDQNLVQAQETRRILDRLAGFTVSPVLWKKIAPGLSAGRVQSVGMALCVQRERERLVFQPRNYWDLQGQFATADALTQDEQFDAILITVNGTSLVSGKHDFVDQEMPDGSISPQPKPNKLLLTEAQARDLQTLLEDTNTRWTVTQVTGRERSTQPPSAFKTSTLQQESNQRLGLSVSQTMRTAQQLYEAGWISYMRTDATHVSQDAHDATLKAISSDHGPQYCHLKSNTAPAKTTKKKSKKPDQQADKVAQEAHEAIRPAIREGGLFAHPQEVLGVPEIAQSLYALIYQRTLASRMPPQKTNQTTVTLEGQANNTTATVTVEFRATGSVVLEPGFTLSWNRGSSAGDQNRELPAMVVGQTLDCEDLEAISHTTQPPPRYTEASLVKELEALGVGRPSTYAGIVQILRDRAYVGSPTSETSSNSNQNRKAASGAAITAQRAAGGGDMFGARGPLAPSLSAFVVTSLLEKHCPTYVDPAFTAHMEENLDRIAQGRYGSDDDNGDNEEQVMTDADAAKQRVAYLNEFYAGPQGLAAQIKKIDDEVEAEEARRAALPTLSGSISNDDDEGQGNDDIGLYIGPWGPYIQQKLVGDDDQEPLKAPLPAGMATDLSSITTDILKALVQAKQGNGTLLGQHPDDGRNIYLKVGRFGAYLQWGDTGEDDTTTHSLPKQLSAMRNLQSQAGKEDSEEDDDDIPMDEGINDETAPSSLTGLLGISLDEAVGYCGLPRTVTTFEDKPIIASIGPYGPYLKFNNKFMSLHSRDGDVLTIDGETAERLVVGGIINKKSGRGQGVLAELGEMEESMVTVKRGRFGEYLNWKKINAKLPAEYADDPESMPLEEAWALIQEKAASSPKGVSKKGTNTKATAVDLPPAPKRPKSAYLYFCADKRPEVAKETKALGDISKKLAEMWSETTAKDRHQYEQMAAAEKEQYNDKKKAWEAECKALKKGKASASTGESMGLPQPKRAKSAYLYFCDAHRAEVSSRVSSLGEISKELARLWSETSERSEYEALALADKERYEKEKAEFGVASKTINLKGVTGSRSNGTRRVNGRITNAKDAKPKRAPSAYMIFCREMRHTIVDENEERLPLGETTKRLAQQWKECDEETRSRFQAMAAEEKEKLLVGS